MTITTTTPPEAQLEARINATLSRVFVGTTELRHQLRFKLRVGRTTFDAGASDYVEGRADILVYQGDAPLAVLELKREGLALTSDDEAQGRSYALLAQAPIVVITNGTDTRIFQTHDMARLECTSVDADELARRIRAASTAAQSGVSSAIGKLLGKDLAAAAVRAMTSGELAELTGDWDAGERFVEDFLVPRRATREVRDVLRSAQQKATVIAGPPLSGKSSLLRELAVNNGEDSWDVLYIEGASCNEGIFRRLANVLATEFSWPASTDDARLWLRQLANRSERSLVLCLDTLPVTNTQLVGELDELLSGFGDRLRIVIAVDENEADSLLIKPNRRERTRLGRNATVIKVGNYDDSEFELATQELARLGGGLVQGAQYAPELRAPWVLRSAAGSYVGGEPTSLTVVIPPLLGPQMFEVADDRFADLGELRDDLRRLAAAYLNDLTTRRHHGDVLAGLQLFSIRRDVVQDHLERGAIQSLVQAGLLRRGAAISGETIYVVQVPELFGHELAAQLAARLPKRVQRDAREAAKWLTAACSKILFGDAVGAYAISRAMLQMGAERYVDLINELLRLPPRREKLAPGSRMVTLLPDMGLVDVKVESDGALTLSTRGTSAQTVTLANDEEDEPSAIADMDGWLILSQMREFRIAFEHEDGELVNLAVPLLMEVGKCKEVLRRPGQDLEGFHTHEIDGGVLSCARNGIVEPVTWAIAELLSNDVRGVEREEWVRAAADSGSFALVNRMSQALTHLSATQGSGQWAGDMLEKYVRPTVAAHPMFH